MNDYPRIRMGWVYQNQGGELRLVTSCGIGERAVVQWRTVDPKLPAGAHGQGSATVASFRAWVGEGEVVRKGTNDDWAAFRELEAKRARDRREAAAIRRIKKRQRRQSSP